MLKYLTETALGANVDDETFEKAVVKAKNKQYRIYNSTGREEVKMIEYLAQLVKEAIVENEFMNISRKACGIING